MPLDAQTLRLFDSANGLDTVQNEESLDVADVSAPQERLYLCGACALLITWPTAIIKYEGCHEHFFTNPAGLAFRLTSFSEVEGCVVVGEETGEFTFFPGFLWSIALCRGCSTHLGWRYRAPERTTFYGLILDRLVLVDESQLY